MAAAASATETTDRRDSMQVTPFST
jgi:hypothetical protein